MTQNENTAPSFKRKLGNTTYTVRVHFNEDTDKTFKDRMQRSIMGDCAGRKEKIKQPEHEQESEGGIA